MHLEEKLYLIEILIHSFDFFSAWQFAQCIIILLHFTEEGEEASPYGTMKNDFNPNRV